MLVHDRVKHTTEVVSVRNEALNARAGKVVVRPSPPRAGKPAVVSMHVSVAGRPAARVNVGCFARVSGRPLRVGGGSYQAGVATCPWVLPRGSHGKLLRGRISALTANGSVERKLQARIR